jgi:hypothetical protein
MQVIPLTATPSQSISALLAGQLVSIFVYQKRYGMFCDVYVSGTLLIGGVACMNLVKIIRSAYLGFIGDLCFYDTQGTSDPTYDGLGGRYVLLYLETTDPKVAT